MKKYVFLLAVVFCCRLAYAENLEKFLNSFSDKTGVEKIKIGPLVMKTSGIFTETKGISSIEILDLSECQDDVKENFRNGLRTIKDSKYEPLLVVKDDNEMVRILIRTKKDVIQELVIATYDEEDMVLIRIKGKIKPKDVEKIIEENR